MMQQTTTQALRLDRMPQSTQRAFLSCIELEFFSGGGWYLAGGTALALQVGHRVSVDLDFFTSEQDFDADRIEKMLAERGEWMTTLREKGTLYGLFQGAKMSFIAYPSFHPSGDGLQCQSVRLLLPKDIAAMKIMAVSQRGKKRDFVDLYWLAQHGVSLEEALLGAIRQYGEQHHSLPHFLKSLVYFADAEDDPMPEIFFQADWKTMKNYFEATVPALAKKMLHLE
ncbi:MAG: nucleotidyl transferase AbiEii/AbiGii toxin family protein [Candidatus Moranbacteria bacterium]|nr:nucleotidyl transferase AbiEii/AbiGii toxin family protein [Candidatus Moranbacteria bacterium]